MNPNLDFLRQFSDLSDDSFSKLKKISHYREVPAKTIISKAGEFPKYIYLLVSGVLRVFITTENGKDYNKRLYSPISFAGPLTSIIKQEPSEISYETLTDCKLFEIDFEEFKELCRLDFQIGKLYVRILEYVFIIYEERNLDLMILDGKDRYLKLLNQIPNIEELIPQYQIASYLGITPVQLSRIRKTID